MEKLITDKQKKIILYWLYAGLFMTIIQILLGGITRLTGSGLSITEWQPIMGAIPPMNETEWNVAFDAYKKTGQFQYLNSHFELSDFKLIFFWEWFHRLWARTLGFVFLIPFVFFWIKGYFSKQMVRPLIILFLLGILQAAIGWIMVASGLNPDDIYVSHIRLAVHFGAAFLLLAYIMWFILQIQTNDKHYSISPKHRNLLIGLIGLLIIQFSYGAFMAGLKAAPAAPTWPDINGEFIPSHLGDGHWTNSAINVHFVHRTLAYIIFFYTLFVEFHLYSLAKTTQNYTLKATIKFPIILLLCQVGLGIAAVLTAPKIELGTFGIYEFIAILHQTVAILLLMSIVIQLYITKSKQAIWAK